jgi:O-antigen/teichoic acid export membrane protein
MWTTLSWLLIPYLGSRWNFVGASLGYFLVSVSSFVAYFVLKRLVKLDTFYSLGKPFISSFVMGLVLYVFYQSIDTMSLFKFILLIIAGSFSYGLVLFILTGKVLFEDVKKTLAAIFKK